MQYQNDYKSPITNCTTNAEVKLQLIKDYLKAMKEQGCTDRGGESKLNRSFLMIQPVTLKFDSDPF